MIKIIKYKELNRVKLNFQNNKIILVGGCFDVFHFGHLLFLKKAKEAGNFLVVALESDEFIKKYKKRNPVHNQNQRAEILAAIEYVDLVIKLPLFDSDKQYLQLVEEVKPPIIAITAGDSQLENKIRQAKKVAGKVKIITNYIKGFSSQEIIGKFG
jgi:rfaE bifunctional protein nucleotidyltransferase chain/domain